MNKNNKYYYCNVVGNTDVGCVRKNNEDYFDSFECDNGLVAVVCDGMGGHVGGQIASHTAVTAIKEYLSSNFFENPKEAIINACNEANKAILERTKIEPELTGMGSTCVMLIVREGHVFIGSIGDSRVYLIRSRKIRQLTKDQSYVQMLVDMGQISKEEAEHHPRKNEITNALGLPNMTPALVLDTPINPEAGDCFLLCSDGLTDMVPDNDIAKAFANLSGESQVDRVNMLINHARKNGGLDNITCQIVEFSLTPSIKDNKASGELVNRLKKIKKIVALFIVFSILISGVYHAYNLINNSRDNLLDNEDGFIVKSEIKLKRIFDKPIIMIDESNRGLRILSFAYDGDSYESMQIDDSISLDSIKVEPAKYVRSEKNDKKTGIRFYLNKDFEEDFIQLVFKKNGKDIFYRYDVSNIENCQSNENDEKTSISQETPQDNPDLRELPISINDRNITTNILSKATSSSIKIKSSNIGNTKSSETKTGKEIQFEIKSLSKDDIIIFEYDEKEQNCIPYKNGGIFIYKIKSKYKIAEIDLKEWYEFSSEQNKQILKIVGDIPSNTKSILLRTNENVNIILLLKNN